MQTLQVLDKTFRLSIPEADIQQDICRVAAELQRDLGDKQPLFLPVLNGSFIFAADLLRQCAFPCEVSFIKVSSYEGMQSVGTVRDVIGLQTDIEGRHLVVVEDIIDSGVTMSHLLQALQQRRPASISVCTLLLKPDALQCDIPVHYCCRRIPNDFVVGYGLDYDGFGRNTRDIYTLA